MIEIAAINDDTNYARTRSDFFGNMNDISRWYAVLGVSPTASLKTIKEAYRELAKLWHPDIYIDDPELKSRAEAEIKEINQAYGEIKVYLTAKLNDTFKSDHSKTESNQPSKIKKIKQTPEFYYQQGVTLANQENYDDALTSFALALKLNADYLEAYQYRGFILAKLGFNFRADAEFKKAHQIKLRRKIKQPQNEQDAVYGSQQASVKQQHQVRMQNSLPLQYWQTIFVSNQPCQSLVVAPGGVIAGINGSKEIGLWQANTGQALDSLKGHGDRVSCLVLSPSGETLISGSKDQTIRFWDLRRKRIRCTFDGQFDGHLSEITTLAVSPDNQILLSCDRDNSLKIWDINHGRVIKNISFSANVTCMAINPHGQLFCSGGLEPQIRIRQIKDGQVMRSINHNSGVTSLAFSPNGKLLATGGLSRTIKIWEIATGKEIYTFEGHCDRISKIIFSNDGQTLISSSWDKTIKLWELTTGKEITTISVHTAQIDSMAIAPNHQLLATSSSDRTIKLWQVKQL